MIPYTHLNSPTVFECKSGIMGSTMKVEGVPFVTQTNDTLNRLNEAWHQALTILDEQFIQYVTVYRKKENLHLSGEFSSEFARQVNEKYHARFNNKSLFKNEIYLTTLLKGDTKGAVAKGLHVASKIKNYLNPASERAISREEHMILLNGKINQLKSQLSSYMPHVLGEQDESLGFSELIRFLSLFPNAEMPALFQNGGFSPVSPSVLDASKEASQYPIQALGQYISSKRVLFGDYIQFQGATPDDCRYGAMLSLKKYGKETSSIVLDPLYELNCEFISTHSFAPIRREQALKEIDIKRGKLINSNDLGESQIAALSQLEDDLSSESALLGYHHNSLLLLADSIEALNHHVLEAIKAYAYSGIVLVREILGAEPVFFAQMPGNHHCITRASTITSHNFVEFCSLHNHQTGFSEGNHLGGAITLLETTSKTPVYFNFHSRGGSKTNPAPGHTAVFGATNAGKNTLVAFLDAQMGRFSHRSFFLDRNQASKIYCLSHESSTYTRIHPDNKLCQMNPFQLDDTADNRNFLKNFMSELVRLPNEEDIPSALSEALNECVNYAYECLEKPYRQLTHVVKCLPVDFPRWPELRRFLSEDDNRPEGQYAWLFDNQADSLQFDDERVGFDITYLMDSVSKLISTPAYMFLLHRIRQSLDGRLTSIVMDEAWQLLDSPFWVGAIKSDIATIRKLNGFFIFMTQSPETVKESAIAPQLMDNLITTIVFPNPAGKFETYRAFGLSEAEFDIIKNTRPESRQFLYCQKGEQSIFCKLDLSDLPDEIRVFSGNQKTVDLLDEIVSSNGLAPKQWMQAFIERSKA